MDVHEDTDVILRIRYYCHTLKLEDIRWCIHGCLYKMVDAYGCNDGCQGRYEGRL